MANGNDKKKINTITRVGGKIKPYNKYTAGAGIAGGVSSIAGGKIGVIKKAYKFVKRVGKKTIGNYGPFKGKNIMGGHLKFTTAAQGLGSLVGKKLIHNIVQRAPKAWKYTTKAARLASGLGGMAAGAAVAAGSKIAANRIQQKVAKKRIAKYGQKGSALVPNKKITGGTGVGDAMREAKRSYLGEKTFQGTASTVKGMRKEARYHRQTVKKANRITERNKNIAIKNQAMKERSSVVPSKTKKTYQTTGQKIKSKIKNIFGNKFNTPPSPTANVEQQYPQTRKTRN